MKSTILYSMEHPATDNEDEVCLTMVSLDLCEAQSILAAGSAAPDISWTGRLTGKDLQLISIRHRLATKRDRFSNCRHLPAHGKSCTPHHAPSEIKSMLD